MWPPPLCVWMAWGGRNHCSYLQTDENGPFLLFSNSVSRLETIICPSSPFSIILIRRISDHLGDFCTLFIAILRHQLEMSHGKKVFVLNLDLWQANAASLQCLLHKWADSPWEVLLVVMSQSTPISPSHSLPLSLSSLSYHRKFKKPNSQKCTVKKVNKFHCDFMRLVVLNFGNLRIPPHLWYCSVWQLLHCHYTSKYRSFASAACCTASRFQSRSDLWWLFYLEWKLEHLLL